MNRDRKGLCETYPSIECCHKDVGPSLDKSLKLKAENNACLQMCVYVCILAGVSLDDQKDISNVVVF